jgi:microcystin degradation protein MlrC
VVITTDNQPALAATLCSQLASELWRRREEYLPELLSVEDAVERAHGTLDGLIVLSDASDATTSGSPGDSVWILEEMLKRAWRGPVLVTVVAPDIVDAASQAGVGRRWNGRIGGVRDNRFGISISLSADVERLFDARFILNGHIGKNLPIDMGRAAVLRVGNIHVIVTSRSGPHFAPELFQTAGYDPFAAAVLVAKSPAGFRAVYQTRAAAIYSVRAPGCAPSDFWRYPYQQIHRPLWPWDEMPNWEPRPRLFASGVAAVSRSQHAETRAQLS